MKQEKPIVFLTLVGIIAAMYTALTLCFAPLGFGLVQCRISEALTILAAFTPAAVPGLTIGCVVSNLVGLSMGANPAGALDVLLGAVATGLAAWLSWRWRDKRIKGLPVLATLPPVVLNAVIVGAELACLSPTFSVKVLLIQMGLVFAGQAVACIGGGLLLAKTIQVTGLEERLFGGFHRI